MSLDSKAYTNRLMRQAMAALEDGFTECLGQKPGIVLLVWTGDDPSTANYIANVPREETADALVQVGLRLKSGRRPGGL